MAHKVRMFSATFEPRFVRHDQRYCAGGIELIILLYQKSLIIYSWTDTLRQHQGHSEWEKVEDRS